METDGRPLRQFVAGAAREKEKISRSDAEEQRMNEKMKADSKPLRRIFIVHASLNKKLTYNRNVRRKR